MTLGKPLFNSFHTAITNLTITVHIILNTAYRIQPQLFKNTNITVPTVNTTLLKTR